nr:PepSY domain-containing protein [Methylonatrum kenyense]
MSLSQATRMVREETGGRVLSAEEVQRGNRTVYRIRVLMGEGRVRVVEVDPRSGRMR